MSSLHPADWAILAVLGLSLCFGFSRGLVREVISTLGWVLAILVARWFNEPLANWLAQWVNTPSVRLVMSYGILFIGTLLSAGLLAQALSLAVRSGGLSLTDRVLGGLFGVLRGGLLVLIALMLMAPFVKRDAWFHQAQLPRAFLAHESLARQLRQEAMDLVAPESPASPDDAPKKHS